jgi:hypothetical protein
LTKSTSAEYAATRIQLKPRTKRNIVDQQGGKLRIVTIEDFGTLTPESTEHPGHIYEGNAWLLRFAIRSIDHFFQLELDNLCRVLNIDERQIYHMILYGRGRGLFDARLFISFEEPPHDEQIHRLKFVVPPEASHEYKYDILASQFREFLKAAKPEIKRKLAKALAGEKKHASKKTEGE